MSLITRKNKAQAQASAGLDRARQAATRVTPMAKSASVTAAQGVNDAREWAAPRIERSVNDARGWAAPRIEQAAQTLQESVAPKVAQTLQETVAPKVSGMLTATAHRIEPSVQAPKRRLWPRLVAGLAVATAAGGAIAAIVRRRNARLPDDMMPDDDMPQDAAEADASQLSEQAMADAELGANGKGPLP